MKAITVVLLALAVESGVTPTPKAPYDEALARKLGGDERGMKMYALVMLRGGPRQDLPKEESARAFEGHMANMDRLVATGELVFAGPLEKNDRYRGIFIFNVQTRAEAEALVATDPAVQAGALDGEIYMLYGSAALQEVTQMHRRISK